MMSAHVERIYDEHERMATQAMMNRAGFHAKKLKQSQLFKRPTGEINTERTADDIRRAQEEKLNWLAQFTEFKDKIGN